MPRVRGQLAAHRIQERGAPLARAGDAGLLAHARHQVRDHERDDQHDGEGHDVLHVGDREREARRHEEEVEGRHVRDRAEDRGDRDPAAGPRSSRPAGRPSTRFVSSKYGNIANADRRADRGSSAAAQP